MGFLLTPAVLLLLAVVFAPAYGLMLCSQACECQCGLKTVNCAVNTAAFVFFCLKKPDDTFQCVCRESCPLFPRRATVKVETVTVSIREEAPSQLKFVPLDAEEIDSVEFVLPTTRVEEREVEEEVEAQDSKSHSAPGILLNESALVAKADISDMKVMEDNGDWCVVVVYGTGGEKDEVLKVKISAGEKDVFRTAFEALLKWKE